MIDYTDATKSQRIHSEERICGKRATFHVFHQTAKGKRLFDVSFATTPEKAASDMVKLYAELRVKTVVLGYVRCDQSVVL